MNIAAKTDAVSATVFNAAEFWRRLGLVDAAVAIETRSTFRCVAMGEKIDDPAARYMFHMPYSPERLEKNGA